MVYRLCFLNIKANNNNKKPASGTLPLTDVLVLLENQNYFVTVLCPKIHNLTKDSENETF